jgi:glutamine synthetase
MTGSPAVDVRELTERLTADGVDVVRVCYSDLLGVDRGRDVLVAALPSAMEHGLTFCRAIYHTGPQGDVAEVEGGLAAGLPDIRILPDLSTLARIPWEPGVAQCLGDAYEPDSAEPCAEGPREVLRRAVARLAELGLTPVAGPELEYYLCEPDPGSPGGWRRYGDGPGDVYTVGRTGDPDGHLLRTLRYLRDLGLGVTMGNHEFSGGQFEINLDHSEALDAADRAFRFKGAVKEIARTEGRLATFMARPFNDTGGSGFHVHLSCLDAEGRNAFDGPDTGPYGLSEIAHHAIAGVLAHAPALAAFLGPSINSYKRFGPGALAPWLINWGLDDRGAMVRIPPGRGAAARMEVRLGDAGANPYLGIAALVAAVCLGVRDKLTAPPPLEDVKKAAVLPGDLPAALDALAADDDLRDVLGERFAGAYLTYKRDEVARFQRYVTDWEFREYARLL